MPIAGSRVRKGRHGANGTLEARRRTIPTHDGEDGTADLPHAPEALDTLAETTPDQGSPRHCDRARTQAVVPPGLAQNSKRAETLAESAAYPLPVEEGLRNWCCSEKYRLRERMGW